MAILPKGQREQIMLSVMLVAFALVFAYWYYPYNQRAEKLEERRQHVEALVAINQRAKAELAKGNPADLRRQLAEYQQNLELVRTLVPTGNEVPALLEQVSTAARRVGLDIASVDPQAVTEGDQYDTHRYSMAVIGGYHELAEFFTNIGSLSRIVLPVNVSLQVRADNARASSSTRRRPGSASIEARFQLQTYVARRALPADGTAPKVGAE